MTNASKTDPRDWGTVYQKAITMPPDDGDDPQFLRATDEAVRLRVGSDVRGERTPEPFIPLRVGRELTDRDAAPAATLPAKCLCRVLSVAVPPLTHFALCQILTSEKAIEFVGEATDAVVAVEVVARVQPDVLLLYLEDSPSNISDIVQPLLVAAPECRILMLAEEENEDAVMAAFMAGVTGYGVRQRLWPEDIKAAVLAVHRGRIWTCPTVTRRLVGGLLRRHGADSDDARTANPFGLSDREVEILNLVSRGARNKEIAEQLILSQNTVKTYLRRILEKMEARTRQEAVAKGIKGGVLPEWRRSDMSPLMKSSAQLESSVRAS